MQIEIKIENEITKKVDVRLWAAQEALLDLWSTGQLSFHRREREVDAALWNQPYAISSTLGATPPRPSPGCRDSSPNLERAGQHLTPSGPTCSTEPTSAHLNAPTWVTSSRDWTRRTWAFLLPLFKQWSCLFSWRCGIARCPFKSLHISPGKGMYIFNLQD